MNTLNLSKKFLMMNKLLFILMMALCLFGIYAIYSATYWHEHSTFWTSQIRWFLICLPVYFLIAFNDYRWVRFGAIPIYVMSVMLLILVFFIGIKVSGARSWLNLGFGSFQPSQMAIFGGVLLFALFLSEYDKMHPIVRILVCLGITALPCLLILIQPYLGGTLVWIPVLFAMLYLGGIQKRYLIAMMLMLLCAVPLMYCFVMKPYQQKRLISFIDPLSDPQDSGWNILQSLNAIGSAGFWGKGFKAPNTLNALGYIPKTISHTDFVFTVFGEQHGFVGAVILISVFAILLLLGLYIASRARDQLGRLIAVGVVLLLFTHIFMNIGMTVAVTPITGLPLPMVSYGGTFLLITISCLGLLQSIWIHRKIVP
jgi:rod shape determining protein RodA